MAKPFSSPEDDCTLLSKIDIQLPAYQKTLDTHILIFCAAIEISMFAKPAGADPSRSSNLKTVIKDRVS